MNSMMKRIAGGVAAAGMAAGIALASTATASAAPAPAPVFAPGQLVLCANGNYTAEVQVVEIQANENSGTGPPISTSAPVSPGQCTSLSVTTIPNGRVTVFGKFGNKFERIGTPVAFFNLNGGSTYETQGNGPAEAQYVFASSDRHLATSRGVAPNVQPSP